MNKEIKLTTKQAYMAMFKFWEAHWERTQSSDIGEILSDLQLLPDEKPADPAMWHDWEKAVEKILNEKFPLGIQWAENDKKV